MIRHILAEEAGGSLIFTGRASAGEIPPVAWINYHSELVVAPASRRLSRGRPALARGQHGGGGTPPRQPPGRRRYVRRASIRSAGAIPPASSINYH